jgi:Protein of unknown function (DUF1592)/Protein of unknown function (DUF1588)/Protein of unknown function (DUF1587)/Protein of unknown function (DUF1595)/Protein of unknown function (DUF1585)
MLRRPRGNGSVLNYFPIRSFFPLPCLLVVLPFTAYGQQRSFAGNVYPIFQEAGCPQCHQEHGVASATRLRFPAENAPIAAINTFGLSLVRLVDRAEPTQSLLFRKPTNRIPHAGGERIPPGTDNEKILLSWITRLSKLSDQESAQAIEQQDHPATPSEPVEAAVLRRLTNTQYDNTVRDLVQDFSRPATRFPTEDYVNGYKNQYEALSISPVLAEAYGNAAERVAAGAFRRGDSRGLYPCEANDASPACGKRFVEEFGQRAFRRPLDAQELADYQRLFAAQPDALEGARAVIEAMLQSPSFLFWLDKAPRQEWDAYATASRLSYFLWNTTPDDRLLAAARKGELDTPEGLERIARGMLADPRAVDGVDEFVSEWLRFDRALSASREHGVYRLFNARLAAAMTEEARRFVRDVVWNDRNFMTVFTAPYTFVNSDLAAVYQVDPPETAWGRVEFDPATERAGLLGQTLFLTLTSKPDDTAPTGRGLFVREQFLCQHVPDPPPGVDTNLPPSTQSKPMTNRQRLGAHVTNPSCATCHKLIDPIGFGLEKFDAIGARREQHRQLFFPEGHGSHDDEPQEVLLDIDTTGQVAGLPNSKFSSPRELGALLAETPICQDCVVKQLFRYMSGRPETSADRPLIEHASTAFRSSGFQLKEALVQLAVGWSSAQKEKDRHGATE